MSFTRCIPFFVVSFAIGCAGAAPDDAERAAESTTGAPSLTFSGLGQTTHTSGSIDESNPFFQSLGTNGRTCNSCHDARAGWTMTPALARYLFLVSDGTSTLFRPHDEANRPDADVSTVDARRAAYSMLLTKGLTRFTRTVAATAEFTVTAVDDPYGWSTPSAFSSFRRPIPVANVALEPSITWTGSSGDMRTLLMNIMNGGTKFHAQATADLPLETREAAADFMQGLFFAQSFDWFAGRLDAAGATGGPDALATTPFYVGINALAGDSKTGAPFDRESMKMFEAWEDLVGRDWQSERRRQIARGEEAFYTIEFDIEGVAGLNDELGQPTIKGTCTTCHNTPNVGSGSVFKMMNEGLASAARRTSDLPLVTVQNKATGETVQVTDLGRATSTGKWADIGKFKVPTLRGLAARAPYFHNGSAANLRAVLEFYKERFHIDYGGKEDDILAFLQSL